MALGSLPKLSEILAEFGAAGQSFWALNRGGVYVPDTAANAAISTSGSGVRLSQFPNTSADPGNPVVTQGFTGINGAGSWGYSSFLSFGSIAGGIEGETVLQFIYNEFTIKAAVTKSFILTISGTHASGLFTSIQLTDTTGDPTLTSASAAHNQSGGNTTWTWIVATDYSSDWDGSGTQTLTMT